MVRDKINFKVRKFYFLSGKIDMLKKSQGKLELLNMADLVSFKAGRCFSPMKKE